jgi:RNA polymerase sigma-70 factor (ECF subfamily)
MAQALARQLTDHVPQMYRVALRILGGTEEARDVVQDACLKALRGAGTFNGRAALASWLYRITTNCALDHLRRQRRATHQQVFAGELAGMVAALGACPSLSVERRELYEIARNAVKSLPDDCRSAFVLTQLDGYSYDDAAVIEDQPRGTMASRVYRAKKLLQQQISARTRGQGHGERTQ